MEAKNKDINGSTLAKTCNTVASTNYKYQIKLQIAEVINESFNLFFLI